MKKKIIFYILACVAVILVFVLCFVIFFNIQAYLESLVKKRLAGSNDVNITIRSKPPLKIWSGSIDSVDISAKDVKILPLLIKSMDLHLKDIKSNPFLLIRKDPRSIKSLEMTGNVVIDEKALSDYITRNAKQAYSVDVSLLSDQIKLVAKAGIIDVRISGILRVVDNSKIFIEPPKQNGVSGILDMALRMINPIMDFSNLNFSSVILKKLPENERKKWNVVISNLEVRPGELAVSFSISKK